MRKLVMQYLMEHTEHQENYLAQLGDKDLLSLYNETRDTLNSIAEL